ncbi:Glucan endo-1,3-beta-glucosidase [Pseudocercospora fuligena]|uniref:Glucan endo-1,3-beta-glucosidase n=1 Tax=Pseudocercospora fuligena TaxID=685502 RepID=A0A8H6RT98_9PEZI|nr:Glucan endo-1,3-beta-glucosidase [Pseudocercospora fuligena]
MYKLFTIHILFLLLRQATAMPLIVYPDDRIEDVWVSDRNTLNATSWGNETITGKAPSNHSNTTPVTTPGPATRIWPNTTATASNYSQAPADYTAVAGTSGGRLAIDILNKLPSSGGNVYVSGLDPNGRLVMLGRDGTYKYPSTSSGTPTAITDQIAIPLGKPNTTLSLTLPGYLESSRIWIADGTLKFYVVATPNGPGLVEPAAVNANDPNSQVNYAFAELSWAAAYGLYADITAVDFVGLPLGIELEEQNGQKHTVLGTPADAAPRLCSLLKAQAQKDGRRWNDLCVYRSSNSQLIRVLAPSNLISQNPTAFGDYFSQYVNRVWTYYTTHDLTINTQTTPGNVTCRVSGSQLKCNGDNRGYNKPNAVDIFGCNAGPFAIQTGDNGVHLAVVPRLCAAFNRATFFLAGGNLQPGLPPAKYYTNPSSGPKNWYSKFVHQMEVDGRGYAFAYDDVAPDYGDDQSGLVSSPSPKKLSIFVGGSS